MTESIEDLNSGKRIKQKLKQMKKSKLDKGESKSKLKEGLRQIERLKESRTR